MLCWPCADPAAGPSGSSSPSDPEAMGLLKTCMEPCSAWPGVLQRCFLAPPLLLVAAGTAPSLSLPCCTPPEDPGCGVCWNRALSVRLLLGGFPAAAPTWLPVLAAPPEWLHGPCWPGAGAGGSSSSSWLLSLLSDTWMELISMERVGLRDGLREDPADPDMLPAAAAAGLNPPHAEVGVDVEVGASAAGVGQKMLELTPACSLPHAAAKPSARDKAVGAAPAGVLLAGGPCAGALGAVPAGCAAAAAAAAVSALPAIPALSCSGALGTAACAGPVCCCCRSVSPSSAEMMRRSVVLEILPCSSQSSCCRAGPRAG